MKWGRINQHLTDDKCYDCAKQDRRMVNDGAGMREWHLSKDLKAGIKAVLRSGGRLFQAEGRAKSVGRSQ